MTVTDLDPAQRAGAPVFDAPWYVIKPPSSTRPVPLRDLWNSRFLLMRLAKRDVTLRYRQTALGVSWVVLQPLIASLVLSFVFYTVAGLKSNGVPPIVLALCGYLGWSTFAMIITKGSTSVINNAGMVSKVFFPRLLLPISSAFSAGVDTAISLAITLIALVVSGVGISVRAIAVIPLLLGIMLLASAVAAATAALAVPYRDVNYITPIFLQFLMYGSPVAWELDGASKVIPKSVRFVVELNPLVGYFDAIRWALLPGRTFHGGALLRSVIITAIVAAIGVFIFSHYEKDFADVI